MLIMGAPGAGKGTQATALAEAYSVPAISTGDIFRANIRNATELGVKVKAIIEAGEYVPDDVTEAIVADRLAEEDCASGFLLDGFPRTMHQVHFLDRHLSRQRRRINAVVSLMVEPDVLVARLLDRAQKEGRTDDNEDTIRRRMEVYAGQTAPLLFHYERQGLLVEIEGTGTVEEVRQRMLEAVAARKAWDVDRDQVARTAEEDASRGTGRGRGSAPDAGGHRGGCHHRRDRRGGPGRVGRARGDLELPGLRLRVRHPVSGGVVHLRERRTGSRHPGEPGDP